MNFILVVVLFICLCIFIVIALESFIKINLKNMTDMGIWGLTILGVGLLITAVLMPFLVRNYYISRIKDYEDLTDLGAVGDFIGGTTVAFLTAASVVLLLATIIMQRKEIKISQQSIEELVKQTEATVKQAEEAREETKITNATMKKQQFETTFFNMINLHHNILSEIKINQYEGREAILEFYKLLKDSFGKDAYKECSELIKKQSLDGDIEYLEDLLEKWFLITEKNNYLDRHGIDFQPYFHMDGDIDTSNYDNWIEDINNGNDENFELEKQKNIKYYQDEVKGSLKNLKEILKTLDFNKAIEYQIDNRYVEEFKQMYYDEPSRGLKQKFYENIYLEKENSIGHYYRNLYRIVKFIQTETIDSNAEQNKLERHKYRGILRAQLSSFELLMLFYNVVYSKKGEKFKDLLINTNFFDDHLIINDFLWKNDLDVLNQMDVK